MKLVCEICGEEKEFKTQDEAEHLGWRIRKWRSGRNNRVIKMVVCPNVRMHEGKVT